MAEYNGKIELSKRMKAIAEMVPKSGVVADVGCDHGFVSIYLVQNAVADKVTRQPFSDGSQPVTQAVNSRIWGSS